MFLRLAPLVVLVACEAAPSVLVTLEGRAALGELATLDVTVADASGERAETRFAVDGVALPATFVVATEGRSGRLVIAAEGRDAAGALIALGEVEVEAGAGGAQAVTLQLEPADLAVSSTVRGDQQLVAVDRAYAGGDEVAGGADGAALVVFESAGTVRARLIGADGQPAWNGTTRTDLDFPIDDDPARRAGTPVVAAAPPDVDGGYLVAWERPINGFDSTQIWWAIVGADGSAGAPQPLVADDGVIARRFPRLAPVPGGWVAVWQEPADPLEELSGELRLARIDAATRTVGAPVVVAAGATDHNAAQVASSGEGVVVVWEDTRDGAPQLWHRRFDATGAPLGPDAALITDGAPRAPRLAGGELGLALVWWDDAGGATSPWMLQRLDGTGAVEGPPVEIARTERPPSLGEAESSSVAWRDDGTIAVVFASGDPDAAAYDVYLRVVGSDGAACGEVRQVDTTTAGVQQLPAVAGFGADAFVVAWNDGSASVDDPDGTAVRGRIVYAGCP